MRIAPYDEPNLKGNYMNEITEKRNSERICRLWAYDKPKEINVDSVTQSLYAIGLNYNMDLIIFDLYSMRFLNGIQRGDLFFGLILKTPGVNSAAALGRNLQKNAEINKRKQQIHAIMHSAALQSELLSDSAYQSGIKVNRVLDVVQKKHKILLTYTVLTDGREKKYTIPIYDTIKDYNVLIEMLNDYKKKSENVCPYCGTYMDLGYCENCIGKEPVTEDPVKAKKQKISLIAYTTIAVLMIVIMLFVPGKSNFIVLKIILIILALAFTVATISTAGEIIKEKNERVV